MAQKWFRYGSVEAMVEPVGNVQFQNMYNKAEGFGIYIYSRETGAILHQQIVTSYEEAISVAQSWSG